MSEPTSDQWRDKAREIHCLPSDDAIKVDDDCQFSWGDDGCWVSGWLWVSNADMGIDDEGDDES